MDKIKLQELYQLLSFFIEETNPDNLDELYELVYKTIYELKYYLEERGFKKDNSITRERALDIARDYIVHDLETSDLNYVQDVANELGITNKELYELGLENLMNITK